MVIDFGVLGGNGVNALLEAVRVLADRNVEKTAASPVGAAHVPDDPHLGVSEEAVADDGRELLLKGAVKLAGFVDNCGAVIIWISVVQIREFSRNQKRQAAG